MAKTRKQKNTDRNLAAALGALAVVCQIEHWWAYVVLGAAIAASAYLGLRLRRRADRRRADRRRAPVPARPRTVGRRHTVTRLSAECAGNDHLVCTDKRCDCRRCDHPALRTYARAARPAGDPPLPRDLIFDVPPF